MEIIQDQEEGFSARHRWSGWINIWFSVVSVLVLVIALNYFSHRHYQRTSWTDNLQHKLSARTEQLLTEMTNEVDIIVFYDRTESTYKMVDELLRKYGHINKFALFDNECNESNIDKKTINSMETFRNNNS